MIDLLGKRLDTAPPFVAATTAELRTGQPFPRPRPPGRGPISPDTASPGSLLRPRGVTFRPVPAPAGEVPLARDERGGKG